jgi:hypothetical protein
MKRYVILLLTTLLAGNILHTGVGTGGAQVPVGTGISAPGSSSSSSSSSVSSSDPIPLSIGSFDTAATTALTINTPGTYILIDTIQLPNATTAMISITADDVILNLGGQTLDGGNAGVGIVISSTNNVTIKNGTIRDNAGIGISIPTAMNGLTLENITINDSTGDAIQFAGTSSSVYLKNITIAGNGSATGKGIEVIGVAQNFYLDNFSIDSLSGTGMHAIEFTAANFGITIKNGTITDIGTGSTTDGINFGAASHNILIDNIKIATVTGQGIDLNNSYDALLKDINISAVAAGSGIEVGDSSYDVAIENFNISNIITTAGLDGGIKFGTGAYGIILKNGTISKVSGTTSANGLSFTGTSYGIQIDDLTITNVTGRGIDFNASENIKAHNVMISNTSKDGIVAGVATGGIKNGFDFKNITIADTTLTGLTLNGRPQGISVENLKVNGSGSDGILMTNRTKGLVMDTVMIGNAGGNGINATGIVEDVSIKDFTISHPTTAGIDFAVSCTGVSMINGTISNPTKGINIYGGSNTSFIDNVTISNVRTTDAITTGSACSNIAIQNCNFSHTTADGINIGNFCYGVAIKKCNFTLCKSDGISFGTDCNLVSISDFTISNHITDGIKFGTSAHNVAIKNGAISSTNDLGLGVTFGTGAKQVTMDNLTVDRGLAGILVSSGASNIAITNSNLSNFLAVASNYGIKLTSASGILLQDCKVSNCNETTAESNHAGVWFLTCNDVTCINVNSGSHTGDEAYGFRVDTVTGGYFENCTSYYNTGNSTDAPDADNPEGAVGLFIKDSTGCSFLNCKTNNNVSTRYAYGFYLTGCSGNIFENCQSLRNRATTENALATASGFHSLDGVGNTWNNSLSNGNVVNSATTGSTNGYGSFGFYLGNEQQSTLYKCIAKSNGLITNHVANTTGIFLDGTLQTDCKYCQVRDCEASANCTSATSGTTAYGIRDTATDTTNIIISCMAYGNKDNASPVITKNYYMDLPIGGDTKANWPVTTGTMDSIIEFANLPKMYNIDIE